MKNIDILENLMIYELDISQTNVLRVRLLDFHPKIISYLHKNYAYIDKAIKGVILSGPVFTISKPREGTKGIPLCIKGFAGEMKDQFGTQTLRFKSDEERDAFARDLQILIAGMLSDMENPKGPVSSPRVVIYNNSEI